MRLDLEPVRFLRRYKRFLADVERADGSSLTVHCPNPGSMRSLDTPGVPAWIRDSGNPARRLRHTLTLLGLPGGGRALIDTSLPNAVVVEGIERRRVAELSGYRGLQTEVRYGAESSRIDVLLTDPARPPCYVEVKSNTMASAIEPGRSDFPDSVTVRGTKHLRKLAGVVEGGGRGVLLFLIGRSDCRRAGIAHYIDPAYGRALSDARAAGVEVLAYRARLSIRSATLGERCPVEL